MVLHIPKTTTTDSNTMEMKKNTSIQTTTALSMIKTKEATSICAAYVAVAAAAMLIARICRNLLVTLLRYTRFLVRLPKKHHYAIFS